MGRKAFRPVTAIVATFVAHNLSCPAYSQSTVAPVTVLSRSNSCKYFGPVRPPLRYRFTCLSTALIIDPPRDRWISCYIAMSVEYSLKTGPSTSPSRLVAETNSGAHSGYCYIQPGLSVAHASIFPLDTGQNASTTGVNLYLIYDGAKVTACMNGSHSGNAITATSETVCGELQILGNF